MRFLLLFFTCMGLALGQAGRAELFGTIHDASELPIPHAHIQAEEQATAARITAQTNAEGEYHLLGLRPGQYTLTVEQSNFRSYQQKGITLRVGDRVALPVTLEVGQSGQSIAVTAEVPLLQTTNGEVSFHVDEKKTVMLPLDGRNFIPLISLSPGVALPNGSLLPRINGSRPRTNEYLYDGISALQPEPGQVAFYPIIDGIAEFRVNINSYSPEYGRSNGGTVMASLKSGTNNWHGDAFEFFRNEDLNARNFFAPAGPKPEFRRNQYGFTWGGPLQKNKTFFFVDWQESRLRTGVTRISTVPTLAQRQGVFTTAIYDPSTPDRAQFPNNIIPVSRIDPVAQQVLGRYPLPNLPGTANNYTRTAVEPDNQDQFDTRLDRYFGEKHRIFGRYSYFRDDDSPVAPLPEGSGSITSGLISPTLTQGHQAVFSYEWTVSPNALNQARFGYTRRSSFASTANTGTISIPGTPNNSFASILPTFAVSGYQQIGYSAGANSQFTTTVTEYLDTFSWIKARHTIKFGMDLRREALNILQPANPTGVYTFNTTGTNRSGVASSGNAVASLLLGQVSAFSIDIQNQALQARAHIAEFFVGDEWRVSNKLSLNYGTRYTLNFPSTEVNNQGAIFNLQTQVLDFPHTARELECCNFGPRVGLGIPVRKLFGAAIRVWHGLV